ncbi:t-SNARE [Tothia fuscella]|uniref:t-SNARE n=1 Tax=Tothia fuscella TaxID=1048955 RepID=A0A9P4NPI4_9PEZI|nr:t-SNARE [Tothia fuscella]
MTTYDSENPYACAPSLFQGQHNPPSYSPYHSTPVLGIHEFLTRVETIRPQMERLTENISLIASCHQRSLSNAPVSSGSAIDHLVLQTQVLIAYINDTIKYLDTDASRSGGNASKSSQLRNLKTQFRTRLEQYHHEESEYKRRFEQDIGRQYRVANSDASEDEVREAMTANWVDEDIFQNALGSKTSSAGALAAIRSRHNDIQQIVRTLAHLDKVFEDMGDMLSNHEPVMAQLDGPAVMIAQYDGPDDETNVRGGEGRRDRTLRALLICIAAWIVLSAISGIAAGIYLATRDRKDDDYHRGTNF